LTNKTVLDQQPREAGPRDRPLAYPLRSTDSDGLRCALFDRSLETYSAASVTGSSSGKSLAGCSAAGSSVTGASSAGGASSTASSVTGAAGSSVGARSSSGASGCSTGAAGSNGSDSVGSVVAGNEPSGDAGGKSLSAGSELASSIISSPLSTPSSVVIVVSSRSSAPCGSQPIANTPTAVTRHKLAIRRNVIFIMSLLFISQADYGGGAPPRVSWTIEGHPWRPHNVWH